MRKQKWGYFCSKWNLLEVAIILASWSALVVFVKRTILADRDLQRYREHRDEYVVTSLLSLALPCLSFYPCHKEAFRASSRI
jgi:polycystin 1L2